MPMAEIKEGIKTLLEASFVDPSGDGRLKLVRTQYARAGTFGQPNLFPQAIIWGDNHKPVAWDAGGRATTSSPPGPMSPIGTAIRDWEVLVHVMHLITGVDPESDGDVFDGLCDDIETMLLQYPTLDGLMGTTAPADNDSYKATTWAVWWSGNMRRVNLPAIVDQERVAYNAFIYLNVQERINV